MHRLAGANRSPLKDQAESSHGKGALRPTRYILRLDSIEAHLLRPEPLSSTLSGFRSRCTMSRPCSCLTASNSCGSSCWPVLGQARRKPGLQAAAAAELQQRPEVAATVADALRSTF